MTVTCEGCGGSGWTEESWNIHCYICDGTGTIPDKSDLPTIQEICDGTGTIPDEPFNPFFDEIETLFKPNTWQYNEDDFIDGYPCSTLCPTCSNEKEYSVGCPTCGGMGYV